MSTAPQPSLIKPPTKLTSPKSKKTKSPRNDGIDGDKWIYIPTLEQKFRFRLPTNCHISKSISAALLHATKIVNTAMKRQSDGEVSIEFGLHMNDGPIADTLSAHSYH